VINLAACKAAAVAFLGAMHINVQPLPDVVVLDRAGWFTNSPTIFLLENPDCGVLVHELVHYAQFLEGGPATDGEMWMRREVAASRVETIFKGQDK